MKPKLPVEPFLIAAFLSLPGLSIDPSLISLRVFSPKEAQGKSDGGILLSLNREFRRRIFYRSTKVMEGDDEALFYANIQVIESLRPFREADESLLESWIHELKNRERSCARRNIPHMFLLGPDKHNIWKMRSPARLRLPRNETRFSDRLLERLQKVSVNFCHAHQILRSAPRESQLFFRLDTHWAPYGAWLVSKEIARSFNMPKPIPDFTFDRFVDRGYPPPDLARLYYGEGKEPSETYAWPEVFEKSCHPGRIGFLGKIQPGVQRYPFPKGPECPTDLPRLLIFGDSYETGLRDFLAPLTSAYFVAKFEDFSPKLIEELKPDYVLSILVERNARSAVDSFPTSEKNQDLYPDYFFPEAKAK